MIETRIYTPSTLAIRWQCSERHIRNLISHGDLKSFKLGKLLRITKQAVEEYEQCNGGLHGCEANSASPGMSREESADVIDLGQATRKRRTAAPRLDLQNLRAR